MLTNYKSGYYMEYYYVMLMKKINRLSIYDLLNFILNESFHIVVNYIGHNIHSLIMKPKYNRLQPWELEVLATFFICIKDTQVNYYKTSLQSPKGFKLLKSIIKDIKDYDVSLLEPNVNLRIKRAFILMINNQKNIQEAWYILSYRNNYFFNYICNEKKINIKNFFKDQFKFYYDEIEKKVIDLQILCASEEFRPLAESMMQKYKEYFDSITISFDDIQARQIQEFKENKYEFYYGFKYISIYPIVTINKKNEIVLPHLILNSFLFGTLQKFTYCNKNLRTQMGKVAEDYVYKIFFESDLYKKNMIIRKLCYGKDNHEAQDLIIETDKGGIFIETKLLTPSAKQRHIEGNDEVFIKRVGEAILQIYDNITNFTKGLFNPFHHQIAIDNIFGLVVFYQDCFCDRSDVYNYLRIYRNLNEYEFDYICSHIKFVSLYNLENVVLYNHPLIEEFIYNRDDKTKWFDYFLINLNIKTNNTSPTLNSFYIHRNNLMDNIRDTIKRLSDGYDIL